MSTPTGGASGGASGGAVIELPLFEELDIAAAPAALAPLGDAPAVAALPEQRLLTQRVTTRRWVHPDVPVSGLTLTKKLGATTEITGKLPAEIPELVGLDMDENWSTRLLIEDENGIIRGSAILTPPFEVAEDDTRSVASVGPLGYLEHQTYDGDWTAAAPVDPLDVVRMFVEHVQAKPGAQYLRLQVSDATSPVRVGGVPPADGAATVGPRTQSDNDNKLLNYHWWEGTIVGKEISELAGQVPFDLGERAAWNTERSDVVDRLELGWPRLGRRRTDLRFAEGENIVKKVVVRRRVSEAVTMVRLRGAGEGRAMILGQASRPAPGQLPVVVDIQDSTVKTSARAKARAEGELARAAPTLAVEAILLDARHPNAPYGSFDEGDDIPLDLVFGWGIGQVRLWHRVTEYAYTRDEERIAVTLEPSQTFRYGATA